MTNDSIDTAFLTGSEHGLAAAYEQHSSLVHTLCARAHPAAAADLTQEVFLAAWRAREHFDPARGPLGAWIVGIAKNKIIDLYRHDARRIPHQATSSDAVERIDDPSQPIEDLADRLLVTEALRTLPIRTRQAVELSFFEQMTHAQISEVTGNPLGTVKSDIRRGLARLRRYLEAAS